MPGGGGWCTAADLALLLQPLLQGGRTHDGGSLVSAETIALATTQKTDERHTRALTEDPLITLQVRRGLVVELAGDDELAVPGSGMDGATFHTDKVELATMAGETIPAKVMRRPSARITSAVPSRRSTGTSSTVAPRAASSARFSPVRSMLALVKKVVGPHSGRNRP